MRNFEDRLLDIGLEQGHFVFASGQHADEKFEFDNIAASPLLRRRVARKLSNVVSEEFPEVDAILTVGEGANVLSRPVARRVGKQQQQRQVMPLVTHKLLPSKEFYIEGGNIHARGLKVAIVDDVYTRGTNITKVGNLAAEWGAVVMGAAVLLNRNPSGESTVTLADDTELQVASVLSYPMADMSPEECDCETERKLAS